MNSYTHIYIYIYIYLYICIYVYMYYLTRVSQCSLSLDLVIKHIDIVVIIVTKNDSHCALIASKANARAKLILKFCSRDPIMHDTSFC